MSPVQTWVIVLQDKFTCFMREASSTVLFSSPLTLILVVNSATQQHVDSMAVFARRKCRQLMPVVPVDGVLRVAPQICRTIKSVIQSALTHRAILTLNRADFVVFSWTRTHGIFRSAFQTSQPTVIISPNLILVISGAAAAVLSLLRIWISILNALKDILIHWVNPLLNLGLMTTILVISTYM